LATSYSLLHVGETFDENLTAKFPSGVFFPKSFSFHISSVFYKKQDLSCPATATTINVCMNKNITRQTFLESLGDYFLPCTV
jgi:hypothetical protein